MVAKPVRPIAPFVPPPLDNGKLGGRTASEAFIGDLEGKRPRVGR